MNYAGKPIDHTMLTIQQMIRICSIVQNSIHSKNYVHNKLTPSNILLLEDTITIIDFSSVSINNKMAFGYSIGYVAPERTINTCSYFASDVYSLGMVFARKVCSLCKIDWVCFLLIKLQ